MGLLQNAPVDLQPGDRELGEVAGLLLAEQVPGAAENEVGVRQIEPVARPLEDLEAAGGGGGGREEHAPGLPLPPPDPPSQLMELGDAESLRVHDDHHRRVRNVDPDLDHLGGEEDPDLSGSESMERSILLVALHSAVQQAALVAPEPLRYGFELGGGGAQLRQLLGLVYDRIHKVDLSSVIQLVRHHLQAQLRLKYQKKA